MQEEAKFMEGITKFKDAAGQAVCPHSAAEGGVGTSDITAQFFNCRRVALQNGRVVAAAVRNFESQI